MRVVPRVLIVTALVFGSGCAKTDWIDRTLVTVSVTGVWAGSVFSLDGQPAISQDVTLELQQQGPRVIGSFRGNFGGATTLRGSTPIEGRVAGDVFTFKDPREILTGELRVNGDEMRGRGVLGNSRSVTFDLRRIDASPLPMSPTR